MKKVIYPNSERYLIIHVQFLYIFLKKYYGIRRPASLHFLKKKCGIQYKDQHILLLHFAKAVCWCSACSSEPVTGVAGEWGRAGGERCGDRLALAGRPARRRPSVSLPGAPNGSVSQEAQHARDHPHPPAADDGPPARLPPAFPTLLTLSSFPAFAARLVPPPTRRPRLSRRRTTARPACT